MFGKTRQTPPTPTRERPTAPVEYPDGACVESQSGHFYIKGGKKYRIASNRVLYSWSFPYVAWGSNVSLSEYADGGVLGFRPGSLLFNDGIYYIVSGNVLRKVSSPDVFSTFGLDPAKALWVSDDELGLHARGEVF
jgi:hypothetical protein